VSRTSRLASPDNITPHKFSLGYLIISRRPNKVLDSRVAHFLSSDTKGRAYRDAGSPGSDGASS
jgi:hypothetical protein